MVYWLCLQSRRAANEEYHPTGEWPLSTSSHSVSNCWTQFRLLAVLACKSTSLSCIREPYRNHYSFALQCEPTSIRRDLRKCRFLQKKKSYKYWKNVWKESIRVNMQLRMSRMCFVEYPPRLLSIIGSSLPISNKRRVLNTPWLCFASPFFYFS